MDAFLYDAVILDYRAGQDDGCKLRVVGSWYAMTAYGIALPKGSKYKEMLDRKIIEYSHSGELERTQKFWFSGSCTNKNEENIRNSNQFGLLQSSSVFLLLLFGIVFSVLSLLAMYLWNKFWKDRKVKLFFYEPTSMTIKDPNATVNGILNHLRSKSNLVSFFCSLVLFECLMKCLKH